jgi:molybdate transport system substrate-binding protein
MTRLTRLTIVALLLVATQAVGDDLLVFAAASLTDVLKELGTSYEKTNHHHVAFNFGASSDLARQITAGAPADVFFSADVARMDEVEHAGMVKPEDRKNVLSNALAIVVPAGSKTEINAPADLKAHKKIALANPDSVPAGIYTKKWLEGLGLWDAVKDKVVPTLDVRACLAAVEAEQADVAVVYATDAAISKKVRVAFTVPRDQGPPITYVLAPLAKSTKHGAHSFVRFLISPEAATAYERYGFIVLPAR